jgi:hypothetical protein
MSEEITTVTEEFTSSGSDLQSEMTGDFFYDDGSDSVVDALGNSQRNEAGEVIRRMEDLPARNKPITQQSQAQPESGKTQQATANQPAGFDSVFTKDSKFDFAGMTGMSSKLGNFSYQMQSVYKQPEGQQQQTPQDSKEYIKTSIDTYKKQLNDERLEPIKGLYSKISEAYARIGSAIPDEVFNAINEVYITRENELKDLVDKKREDLFAETLSKKTSESDYQAAEKVSQSNFKSIADKFIPNVPDAQREEKLAELVFGHKSADGKFVRGYGADVVEALFDAAHQGKIFNSPEEWRNAYNNWWVKYSSNPKNVSYVVGLSFSRYVAGNHAKYRDEYRKTWEEEAANKNRNKNQLSRSSKAIPDSSDNVADALLQYHSAPKRNL